MVRTSDDPEVVRKSQCSANRVWTVLRAALNLAFNEGKVSSDKEWRRVKPFKDVDKAKTRYLTLAECERILNAADQTSGPSYGRPWRLGAGMASWLNSSAATPAR